ncbi:MAG: DUF4136 domain-containing protein [Nannocystaceae bacterium]|nr:DUF4136 domain-containing protein [Nannocystaceae bacterium]
MRKRLFHGVLQAAVLASGLGAAGCMPKVNVHEAPEFEARAPTSFAWVTDELILIQFGAPQPAIRNEANEILIREAVDRELAAKGYERTTAAEADLLLAFSVGVRVRYRMEGADLANGPGETQTKGTLNIYALDRQAHKEVWHGNATRWLGKSEEPKDVVDRAVGRILETFPAAAPSSD